MFVASAGNPSLILFTSSNGWELLTYSSYDSVNAIVNYGGGNSKKISLPASYYGDVLSGGTVGEFVTVELDSIKKQLKKIDSIEIQFGSAEYFWANDKELTQKAIDFVN